MDITLPEPDWHRDTPADGGLHADYISRNGKELVEIKVDPKGLRRFHEGIFHLVRCLDYRPNIKRGYLLIISPQVSRTRLYEEWEAAKRLFSSEIVHRLGIVAVDREGPWMEPDSGHDDPLRLFMQSYVAGASHVNRHEIVVKPMARQKHFEILKVLLDRWLFQKGPISVGKLSEQVGCVYPTTTQTLRLLEGRNYLLRRSNRSVELRCFPQTVWNEFTVLAGTLRQSLRYADTSGGKPDLHYLIQRLEQLKPVQVAWGGVAAARYWHPDFDLHGIPRIDLSMHIPQGTPNLDFLRKLDPALERIEKDDRSPVLVIHPLLRCDPLYVTSPESELPYADPIETALDLQEMGLTAQAGQLLSHFRPEIRLS
jgi:hypothetical protein